MPKPAPSDTDIYGREWTGRYRIRSTWFFGFCVIEELVIQSDGSSVWMRAPFPVSLDRSAA